MQRKWYRSVLEKDIDAVNGSISNLHTSFFRESLLLHRVNWQERRKDEVDEHGHAGMRVCQEDFVFNDNTAMPASKGHLSSVSLRWRCGCFYFLKSIPLF